MSRTKEQLLAASNQVKNETQQGANTADRIGGILYDISEHIGEGGGGGFGGGLDDFGSPGSDEGMEETGEEGEEPVEDMEGEESGGAEEVPMESASRKKKKPLITEGKGKQALVTMMFNKILDEEEKKNKRVNIFDKNLMINEEIDGIVKGLNEIKED
jgi:hypothetical protein